MARESNGIKDMRKQLDNAYNIVTSKNVIKVKHMKNTAKYRPANGNSWKEYWERKSGQNFPTADERCACCRKLTKPKDFVGAHIEEAEDPKKQYIYPLCKSCNDRYGEGKEVSGEFDVIKSRCVRFLKSETKIVEHLEK